MTAPLRKHPLTIGEFGQALISVDDLDPLYGMLHRAALTQQELYHFCFFYWCTYHLSASAALASSAHPWDAFRALVALTGGPRGPERRHFRGLAAQAAVEAYARSWVTPYDAVHDLVGVPGRSVGEMHRRVLTWRLFGPWIAFKVVDMLQSVLGYRYTPIPVMATVAPYFYDAPVQGALIAAAEEGRNATDHVPPTRAAELAFAETYAEQVLAPQLASASVLWCPDRRPGPFELETVLCKYKSLRNGHYHVGHDIEAFHRAAAAGPESVVLQKLRAVLPPLPITV